MPWHEEPTADWARRRERREVMCSPIRIDSMEWLPRGIPEELDTVFGTRTRTELESEALDLRLSMLYNVCRHQQLVPVI
jgi:hypothetical protein